MGRCPPQPCPEDSFTPMRLTVDYSLNSTDPTDRTDPTDGPIRVLSPTETPVWIEVGGEGI